MTPPTFVPSTKPVDELLTEMQIEGHRMVLVVDEFGTLVGLATLEDVVEEIVGEMVSHDETTLIRRLDSGTALVNGWATVDYTNESLGIELPTEGAFETVAGLLSDHLGRLPREDDCIELGGVDITVLDATDTRVRRLRLDWTARDLTDSKPEPEGDLGATNTTPADQPTDENELA